MKATFLAIAILFLAAAPSAPQSGGDWQSVFPVERARLGVQGANPWFNLTPGRQATYSSGKETSTLTVLSETRRIDGVETRVLEDRETKNGKLVELTRDYYAIDASSGDVYYFGEDVDVYLDGKVVSHEGSWLSGEKGAKFGLMMPGKPVVGRRFYQEQAPGVGMDRAEILGVRDTVVTPAGTFENCVHVVETSAIEKGLKDHKWYASGVGQVKDEKMALVRYQLR